MSRTTVEIDRVGVIAVLGDRVDSGSAVDGVQIGPRGKPSQGHCGSTRYREDFKALHIGEGFILDNTATAKGQCVCSLSAVKGGRGGKGRVRDPHQE